MQGRIHRLLRRLNSQQQHLTKRAVSSPTPHGISQRGVWASSTNKRSCYGSPRARGYGWTAAAPKIHQGAGTTRMIYGCFGCGGIA